MSSIPPVGAGQGDLNTEAVGQANEATPKPAGAESAPPPKSTTAPVTPDLGKLQETNLEGALMKSKLDATPVGVKQVADAEDPPAPGAKSAKIDKALEPWTTPPSGDAWKKLPADVRTDIQDKFNPDKLGYKSDFEKDYRTKHDGNSPPAGTQYNREYAKWYYSNKLQPEERFGLSCLHAKFSKEKLWDQVGDIKWVGRDSMLFEPKNGEAALKKKLGDSGYGDWWLAKNPLKDDRWGMRSHLQGPELHFRGKPGGVVEGHLDLHNVGDTKTKTRSALEELPDAIRHKTLDMDNRSKLYTPSRILSYLEASGVKVPRPTFPE